MSGQYDNFSRDYHYLSSIPLAPTASTSRDPTRTTTTPYVILTHSHNDSSSSSSPTTSSSGGDITPIVPSPYENPSSALFPFTPGPLELSPLPPPTDPSSSFSSPPRPPRPSNPNLALIFANPNPNPPPTGPLPQLPEEQDQHLVQGRSTTPLSPLLSYRKPVPSFLPTPPRTDPLGVDFNDEREHDDHERSSSPTPSTVYPVAGGGQGRLSVGTFEGLLQQGEGVVSTETPASALVSGYRDEVASSLSSGRLSVLRRMNEGDGELGHVVWSPRIHLGLDERGVEAREERLRQDRARLQREMMEGGEGRDLGDRSRLDREEEGDRVLLDPHTPSPRRGGRRKAGTGSREFGQVGKRDIPFLSPRYQRGAYEETEDPEEVDQSGPVLRRGSKRLSDLAEPTTTNRNSPDLENPATRPVGQVRRKSRASTLQKMAKKASPKDKEKGFPRKVSREAGNEVEVVVHDSASQDEGEFSDKVTSPVIGGADEGDWERTKREATCLAARMNWSFVEFDSWFARFIHLFYPFAIFAHIPATIFLDFCLLYILVQVALFPAFPSANSTLAIFARRAIIPVPNVAESTGWWVAVGVYAACTAVWLFGVCLWRECGRGYLRRWGAGGGRVQIEKVYVDAASFNYACARSYGTFSFMWQVRLAPLRPKSPLALSVDGTSRLDFVRETLSWYRQNWPTVALLIPRAAISVAVLLLYTTTAYGTSMNTAQFASRDSAFFDATTGALTGFAAAVVLTNCAWAALRLVVLVSAWVGLWIIDRSFSCLRRSNRDEAYSSRYQLERTAQTPSPFGFEEKSLQLNNNALPRLSYGSIPAVNWRVRRQRRLRAAILVCLGSTPLSSTSSSFPSPYLRSPYVLGAGSPWSQLSSKSKSGPIGQDKPEHPEFEERRHANLATRGEEPEQRRTEVLMSSPPRRQGFWSKLSPFVSPSATFHRSPLVSFSRASPSASIGQTTGANAQHRRGTSTQQYDGGDISESRLHRRVRSVPLDDSDYIHFDEVPLSSRDDCVARSPAVDYPRRFSTAPSFPSPPQVQVNSTQYPFPVPSANIRSHDLRLTIPDRPELVSRFSAFSTKPSSTSTVPPPPVPSRPPTSSSLLESQLSHIPSEHLKLSDKLLSELRRVERYDRKIDSRRGSEMGTSSYATAEESPTNDNLVDPTLRYSQASFTSQPDSVGGQSETSTLRGAVRTPDLSRSLATFANPSTIDETLDTAPQASSSPARPLLPPFRLSSDSRADNLSLGPATPVIGGTAHEQGAFGGSPLLGHERKLS
ncbi:hypothetical protein JCM16303_006459 [Sporobolomyces ruberrimus]